ncbi:MAG: flavin reductase [Alteromonadaceae bacterium]|nr:MAG: flavin reductase [Alteromonadaceae bacterium]
MSDKEQELSSALKQGMRYLASGVCIITAQMPDGERVAMTASSVTSVSDNPPSLLVCVNQQAKLDMALTHTDKFNVNILSRDQEDLSNNCARPSQGDSRFQSGNWVKDSNSDIYYLEDALAVFLCEKKKVVAHGTHNIYIGDIWKVHVSDGSSNILVYANGAYHYL